ncbi:uncharacterized protein [Apostichopus japonicus]|uniref:uncharacterized protein isoform X2 n=1 Tax=Stichopus japonicus TaxID=307972 RepID=UPI003AB2A004
MQVQKTARRRLTQIVTYNLQASTTSTKKKRNILRDDARPKAHSRLCSCHFKYGLHKLGGDYVNPSIFKINKDHSSSQLMENMQKKRKHSYHGMSVSNKQMKMPKVSTVARMASGGHSSSSSIPHNSILVHGVPVQNLSQMQGTHNLQRAHQMAQVHHQPQAQVQAQVQAQATAQHQFLTAGRPSAPQSKYADLLVVIEDMGRDIRPTYAGSRMATERLKRGIVHAKSLVRECLAETERSGRN